MYEQNEDNRREHARFTLRDDPEQSLRTACDGVSIRLEQKQWWRYRELGLAALKDISKGGAGFISGVSLEPQQSLVIELNGLRLGCTVMRRQQVQGALRFYGVRWHESSIEQLMTLFDEIGRLRGVA
ncbi:PilZ domain-containing protein [Ferrimonas pelagia]|uniref:PilZ domain-containing protein n=1 Tax=Ferrimonas pelagia TaxID=1177826 RepID=A0ABP9EBF6_9GAMM